MKRNIPVNSIVSETELLELFRKSINEQIKFKNEAVVFERAKNLLIESRIKHIATVRDIIPRIFACLFIASEINQENFTRKTIADLGGVSQSAITNISNEIGDGLDIRMLW